MSGVSGPLAVLAVVAASLVACSREAAPDAPPAPPGPETSGPASMTPPSSTGGSGAAIATSASPSVSRSGPIDWAALRAADAECADCHPEEVAAWDASPMGTSLLPYAGPRRPTKVEARRGSYTHPRTRQRFSVTQGPDAVPEFTDDSAPEAAPRRAAYLIGSGVHTRSYLWAQGDALFEAPLTWYPARRQWGASPGYQVADHPGLYREIRPDCLFCHADPAPHVVGSLNRYADPAPGPIGCARCHGDGRPHIAARLAGHKTDDPVSPGKLEAARRDDVCDQCHLVGAVRVARDGHAFGEFLAGERLEDSIAIFVRLTAGDSFGIASHGERLRRSRCGGGRLACVQCHTPHATHGVTDRSAPCRDCHGAEHRRCGGPGGRDCAACHMRRAQTSDIPHVAMTDHDIRVRPTEDAAAVDPQGPLIWAAHPDANPTEPEARLLLGRAYAEAARMGGPAAEVDRTRAVALLTETLGPDTRSAQGLADLASMYQLAADLPNAARTIERAFALEPGDVRIARATAAARLSGGRAAEALAAIDTGLRVEPESVPLLLSRASALLLLQRGEEAKAAVARAAALRPGDAEVLLGQAALAELGRDADAAAELFGRVVARAPLSIPGLLGQFRALGYLGRWKEAEGAVDGAFRGVEGRGQVPPGLMDRLTAARALAQAHVGRQDRAAQAAVGQLTRGLREPWSAIAMGVVAQANGDAEAALKFLDQAVTWAPEEPMAWQTLATTLAAQGRTELAERARAQAVRLAGPYPAAAALKK